MDSSPNTNQRDNIQNDVIPEKDLKIMLPKRFILVLMGFLGYKILYMLRVNLSVAIVSMVKHYYNHTNENETIITSYEDDANTTFYFGIPKKFDWDENLQAYVLSSFFAGYVITQYPGGRLADIFGSKWLFGIGICVTSLLTIFSPFAAKIHPFAFIICRFLEGLFEGLAFPCMHSMLAKWLPVFERSRMGSFMYSGSHVGTVITMPAAAFICKNLGWPSVFYISGAVGLIWSIFWFYLVHETPEEHPTIKEEEQNYIIINRNNDLTKKKPKLPLKSIASSVPVWALIVAHFGQNWGFYTFLTQLPRYFNILGFDIQQNGLYTALPYLFQAVFACGAGYTCDRLYASGYFQLTTLRKTFNTVAFLVPTACLLALIQIGTDNSTWCIVLFTVALGINGMCYAGYHVTHVDMTPTFASSLMGITNCLANLAGILAPYTVGVILTNEEEKRKESKMDDLVQYSLTSGWNLVFYISCAIYGIAALTFLLFGSNEQQEWDLKYQRQHQETNRQQIEGQRQKNR